MGADMIKVHLYACTKIVSCNPVLYIYGKTKKTAGIMGSKVPQLPSFTWIHSTKELIPPRPLCNEGAAPTAPFQTTLPPVTQCRSLSPSPGHLYNLSPLSPDLISLFSHHSRELLGCLDPSHVASLCKGKEAVLRPDCFTWSISMLMS